MARINELKEQRAKLIGDARKTYEAIESPTAEDEQRLNTMLDDADKIGERIKTEERLADAEQSLDHVGERRAAPPKVGGRDAGREAEGKAEYREAFAKYLRRGRADLDAAERRALQVGTDSEGGYTVDDVLLAELVRIRDDMNVMRGLATVRSSSQDVKMPTEASNGVATWTAEGADYTESDDSFGEITFSSHKVGWIGKVSEELLNDSVFPIGSEIVSQLGRKIGLGEEAAFVNGDGSGKPTGVVGGSSLGVTAAGSSAITSDELIDLYHALGRPYRGQATWMAADSTVKILRKLKDGDNQYLWQPGLQAGQPDSILGRPLVTTDNVPAATTGLRSVLFGDMSTYYIIDRTPVVIQRLDELYAATGRVGFRGFERTDGNLTQSAAVKHLIQA